MLGVPELWLLYLNLMHGEAEGARWLRATSYCSREQMLALRVVDNHTHVGEPTLGAIGDICRDGHIFIIAGGDIQRVTLEIEVGRGVDQTDVAKQTAACVPAGVTLLHGVGLDDQFVGLAIAHPLGDVDLETYITIVCTANMLAVKPHVAHVHDTFEVEQQASSFQGCIGGDGLTVPASPHLLEAAGRETALDIGRHIAVVSPFVSSRCYPGLLYLEIMGYVYLSRVTEQGVAREGPAIVQADHLSGLCLQGRCQA